MPTDDTVNVRYPVDVAAALDFYRATSASNPASWPPPSAERQAIRN